MQIPYVLQGPSGSGKSKLAQAIKNANENIVICSTDDLFYDWEGEYKFDPSKLGLSHELTLKWAKQLLDRNYSVIIDNTNIQRWECREYVRHAVDKNIPVVFIRVTSNFPNVHGVPETTVKAMRERLENLTIESVLESKTPWE
jgi:predicted kinase